MSSNFRHRTCTLGLSHFPMKWILLELMYVTTELLLNSTNMTKQPNKNVGAISLIVTNGSTICCWPPNLTGCTLISFISWQELNNRREHSFKRPNKRRGSIFRYHLFLPKVILGVVLFATCPCLCYTIWLLYFILSDDGWCLTYFYILFRWYVGSYSADIN